MILAIVYLIIGFLAAILVFSNRPKIEIPKSKEFEQIEKEIQEIYDKLEYLKESWLKE